MKLTFGDKIHILGESRTGSTTLMYKLAELKGYNDIGYIKQIRDGINPADGILNEPFSVDEFGSNLPPLKDMLHLENIIKNKKNLIVKDHLQHYEVYKKYYNRPHPYPRLYRNYTKIKLTRRNIWRRSLSTVIAIKRDVWVNYRGNRIPHDTPLYINPIEYRHELIRDSESSYNLEIYKPHSFHIVLDYSDLEPYNLTCNKTLKNSSPENLVTNISELWDVFKEFRSRVNRDKNSHYTIVDENLIVQV